MKNDIFLKRHIFSPEVVCPRKNRYTVNSSLARVIHRSFTLLNSLSTTTIILKEYPLEMASFGFEISSTTPEGRSIQPVTGARFGFPNQFLRSALRF
ncbi:hypothetical protein CDAR_207551 [Caerostris darwini]|uniref:Uncharacterized protein n=1 Tax=Caerostris darwini TaxID=1538125 RepID=A0AAV4VH98_9ARAC|nr:hypothetical protein CDAR_207551 [Caerostris darwini]